MKMQVKKELLLLVLSLYQVRTMFLLTDCKETKQANIIGILSIIADRQPKIVLANVCLCIVKKSDPHSI